MNANGPYSYRSMQGNPRQSWFLDPHHGFRIRRTGFRILCLWNLYSGFKWSVGLRIPLAVFRIP